MRAPRWSAACWAALLVVATSAHAIAKDKAKGKGKSKDAPALRELEGSCSDSDGAALWWSPVAPSLGHPIKILGRGEVSKKLTVRAHAFSATAKEKIEAAGTSVTMGHPRA
jgi:hypothetical protein